MSKEKNRKGSLSTNILTGLLILCLFSSPVCAFNHYLQLGVFNKRENAQRQLIRLSEKSEFPISIQQTMQGGKSLYAVIVDGFTSSQAIKQYQALLKRDGVQGLIKQKVKSTQLYRFANTPFSEAIRVSDAYQELHKAVQSPQYLLNHDVNLPTSPDVGGKKPLSLSLQEAILLSLRYNPALQSKELDRIIQRFQLRLAENNFELQYALKGSANLAWSKTSNIRGLRTNAYNITPEVSLNTIIGGKASVSMSDNFDGSHFNPQVTLSMSQPLLRGFGPTVTETPLRDQQDTEISNILNLRQSAIDTVTSVITAYRSLIQQNNALATQKQSVKDAKRVLWVNKKRIEAGELEPTGNIQQSFQVSSLETNLQSQENAVIVARQTLLTAVGLDPKMAVTVPSDVTVGQLAVPDLQKTIEYALAHNTAYLNALIEYRKDKRAYNVALNEQLWQLDLDASASYGSTTGVGGDSNIVSLVNGRNTAQKVGLTLSVPINDLSRQNKVITAKVKLENDRLQLLAKKRQLITDVINNVNNIKTQVNLYQMNIKQLTLAEQSYQIEVKKQEAGIATSLDVTNTQNQLIGARNDLIAVKIAYLEQVSALQKLLTTTLEEWKLKMRFL